jgi:hypothetical protein
VLQNSDGGMKKTPDIAQPSVSASDGGDEARPKTKRHKPPYYFGTLFTEVLQLFPRSADQAVVMITILTHAEHDAIPHREQTEQSSSSPAVSDVAGDWEMVVGPRQVASMAFVATIAVAVCSSVAYLSGKALAEPASAAPAVEVRFARPVAPHLSADGIPVFQTAATGKYYVQIAAAEKPVAVVVAEGLRTHGFDAFVVPGAEGKPLRVLVGPVAQGPPYFELKAQLEKLGLSSFPHME